MVEGEGKEAASIRPRASWKVLPLLAVSALVVVWLARGLGGSAALGRALRGAALEWLLIAVAVLATSVVLAVLRWRLVLETIGHRLAFRTALRVLLATWPLSIVAPSRANDLLRAHALRRTVPPVATVASVLAERAVDVQSLCLLAAAGAAHTGQWALAAGALAAAVGEWVVLFLLVRLGSGAARRLGRFGEKLERLVTAFRALGTRPGRLLGVSVLSLGVWLCNVGILYALTEAVHAGVLLGDAVALWPLALFVGLLPVTFGGLGTRDAAFSYLLGAFALHPPDRAGVLVATVGYAVLTTGVLGLVGLPFMASWWLDAGKEP